MLGDAEGDTVLHEGRVREQGDAVAIVGARLLARAGGEEA